MKIIAFMNQKGGVGKTEGSKNTAVGLALKGYKVLAIDLDQQGNLTKQLMKDEDLVEDVKCSVWDEIEAEWENAGCPDDFLSSFEIVKNKFQLLERKLESADVLDDPNVIHEAITNSKFENLDVIPAGPSLLDKDFTIRSEAMTKEVKSRLYKALVKVFNDYDYCIIDTAPITNTITLNVLYAVAELNFDRTNHVLIPIKNNSGAWEGYVATINYLLDVCRNNEIDADFKMAFMMTNRTKNDASAERVMKRLFNKRVMDTTVRNQPAPVTNSSFARTAIITEKANVSEDYRTFVDEIEGSMN